MNRIATLVVLVACHPVPPTPLQPVLADPDRCGALGIPLHDGLPFATTLSWTCLQFGEGYGLDGAACNQAIVHARASCDGAPCESREGEHLQTTASQGSITVRVVPSQPGPLVVRFELEHANGRRDQLVQQCMVEPHPDVVLDCAVRDASGAYVACPDHIAAGAEVHLRTTTTLPPGIDATDHRLAGVKVLDAGGHEESAECHDQRTATGGERRCTWIARAGTYRLLASYSSDVVFTERPLEVTAPPVR
jgi:hypothetical protein